MSAEPNNPAINEPLVTGDQTFSSVSDAICSIPEADIKKTPKMWYLAFGISMLLLVNLKLSIAWLFWKGGEW